MGRSCINCAKNDVCVFYIDGMMSEFLDEVEGNITKLVADAQAKWASNCRSYLEKKECAGLSD